MATRQFTTKTAECRALVRRKLEIRGRAPSRKFESDVLSQAHTLRDAIAVDAAGAVA